MTGFRDDEMSLSNPELEVVGLKDATVAEAAGLAR